MRMVALGAQGLKVSALGLGCMGMSQMYGPADDRESVATIQRALDLGVTMFDTANTYGTGHNERLLGRALVDRRDVAVVATKFGIVKEGGSVRGVDGRPDYVKMCCDESLAKLGIDHIDLYYQHRVDPAVPIEETVGAMAELVDAGKVRYLGLSEASADSIDRAAATHPITALQTEWSLLVRDIEEAALPAARRHGIGIVPYSPLGRGFLTGALTDTGALSEEDFRRTDDRFRSDNLRENLDRLKLVRDLAAEKGATPGQVALAWLLAQGDDIVPIPGTKRHERLEENCGALTVVLSGDDVQRISDELKPDVWAGARHTFRPEGTSRPR